ncbi:MAG: hypothetical protein ACOCXM_01840 [Myxococcota bacterium]
MTRSCVVAVVVLAVGCGASGAGRKSRAIRTRASPPAPAPAPAPPSTRLALDVTSLPVQTEGGVISVNPADADDGVELTMRLVGGPQDGAAQRTGQALFDVRGVAGLQGPWDDRTRLRCEVRAADEVLEGVERSARAHLVLRDAEGRQMFLPDALLSGWTEGSDGWVRLEGRPTTRIPIPLGHVDEGFDASRVEAVGVGLDAQRPADDVSEGKVQVRHLSVEVGPEVVPEVPAPDPAIRAGETERARRMERRLAQRLGVGDGDLAVGVNLPHPSVEGPDGEVMQLYARYLDASEAWFGEHQDLTHPEVRQALREDFARIRRVFGERAPVRVMLFGDLRTGLETAPDGTPLGWSARARRSLATLLEVAREERVVLIPVLTDFLMADGRDREGPGGEERVGERADLILDPAKRRKFFELVEQLVRAHAGDPAVLVWEVMNEPENAVAVVTHERFGALVRFLAEGVDAIHRAGELATVGHRDPEAVPRLMRGRVATDLGQAHYYPGREGGRAGFDLTASPEDAFGPLPAGWGEVPVRPGRVRSDLDEARDAGHRYLLYWAWRGDDPTGDGFRVRAHVEEIRDAL